MDNILANYDDIRKGIDDAYAYLEYIRTTTDKLDYNEVLEKLKDYRDRANEWHVIVDTDSSEWSESYVGEENEFSLGFLKCKIEGLQSQLENEINLYCRAILGV